MGKESRDDNDTAATQIERVNLQKNQERTLTNEPTNIVESMQMKAVSLKVEEEKMLTDYSNHFRMTEIINSKEEKDFIQTNHNFKESQDDNITAATQIKRACLQKNQERTLTNEPTNIVESMRMRTFNSKEEEEKILTDYSNPLRMTEIIDSKEEKDFVETSPSFKESQDDNTTAA